jgi:ribA/ribD-fused uncharacterized protein
MKKFPGNELNKESEDAVYFFTPDYYILDNFFASIVEIYGMRFQTSEHAYQWKKYSESAPEVAEEIFNATNPSQVKKIADANKAKAPHDFKERKVEIMEEILRAKLAQHEKVRRVLIESRDRRIAENSPTDDFWGLGPNKDGKNMLGRLWMKIREELI